MRRILTLLCGTVLVAASAVPAAGQAGACRETLTHLASRFVQFRDPKVTQARQAILDQKLGPVVDGLRRQGTSLAEGQRQALQQAEAYERTLRGEVEVIVGIADPLVIDLDDLRRKLVAHDYTTKVTGRQPTSVREMVDLGGTSMLAARLANYVITDWAAVANRETAAQLGCLSGRGSATEGSSLSGTSAAAGWTPPAWNPPGSMIHSKGMERGKAEGLQQALDLRQREVRGAVQGWKPGLAAPMAQAQADATGLADPFAASPSVPAEAGSATRPPAVWLAGTGLEWDEQRQAARIAATPRLKCRGGLEAGDFPLTSSGELVDSEPRLREFLASCESSSSGIGVMRGDGRVVVVKE